MLRMRSRLFGEHALTVRQNEGAEHEDIHNPSLDFVNRMLANRNLTLDLWIWNDCTGFHYILGQG